MLIQQLSSLSCFLTSEHCLYSVSPVADTFCVNHINVCKKNHINTAAFCSTVFCTLPSSALSAYYALIKTLIIFRDNPQNCKDVPSLLLGVLLLPPDRRHSDVQGKDFGGLSFVAFHQLRRSDFLFWECVYYDVCFIILFIVKHQSYEDMNLQYYIDIFFWPGDAGHPTCPGCPRHSLDATGKTAANLFANLKETSNVCLSDRY